MDASQGGDVSRERLSQLRTILGISQLLFLLQGVGNSPHPPLQIKKQEGGRGKEITVTEITSILGQRDSRRKMDGGEAH